MLGVTDGSQKYTNNDIEQLFSKFIVAKYVKSNGGLQDEKTNLPVYLYVKNNKVNAYAIPISGYGLWSTLYGYFSVEGDGETVKGLRFINTVKPPVLALKLRQSGFRIIL